ncbi:MAG: UDP-N-acetylmuramoyl-L-alanine--D-glutamate ligase [Clostridiales bacterium]|nr:UDP-N-acetylmuramoyl-L-alanine--D-glutamate ligase [Clostridiales bacterium]
MEFGYKNVLIWGYGISGRAVEKVLIDLDVDYTIMDEGIRVDGGGFISKVTKKNIADYDLIVISPGVSGDRKELEYARSIGIRVVTEVEFGYMFLSSKTKVIAVTGTNGKTTTVNLIYHILHSAGYSVAELGNIGKPMTEVYGENYDYVVVELSSFQLQYVEDFHANIAILLNVAPDHIDRHKTFENYLNAKLNIFCNQTKKDYMLSNVDDEIFNDIDACARTVTYSFSQSKARYTINNGIIMKGKEEYVDLKKMSIAPVFYQDVMCAVIVADIIKVDLSKIIEGVQSYTFLPHRCEYVTTLNDVDYYNDSKATNIHATQKCIKCLNYERITILIGGKNKSLDLKEMILNMDKKVHRIIAFGECSRQIYSSKKLRPDVEFFRYRTLSDAMVNISKWNTDTDCVVLSPACASFDEFTSYIARGEYFRSEIGKLVNEKQVKG